MPSMTTDLLAKQIEQRAQLLFRDRQQLIYKRTDRMFCVLLLCQWLAGIGIALYISPRTWAGQYSDVHIHVWTALFLGGLIIAWPVFLAITRPGEALTRHIIAIAQALYSALLIHLTGGRIETHFHIFGSLAFLSFYRDWRVLMSASAVVAGDHCLRGLFFPQSVYGVTTIEPWRWLEHAWWVVFEDLFLIRVCLWNVQEMRAIAHRQAEVEQINSNIEALVDRRTEDLIKAQTKLTVQHEVSRVVAEAATTNEAIAKILRAIAICTLSDRGRVWGAFWSDTTNSGSLQCLESMQRPEGSLSEFEKASRNFAFVPDSIPGRAFASHQLVQVEDVAQDHTLPRASVARAAGLNSVFAFPVMNQNTVLGVIEFFIEKPFTLDADTTELFQTLGSQIGQLIRYKRTETERERLASVVQHSSDAIFTISVDGLISSWNRGAERLFGCTAEHALGMDYSSFIPPEKKEELLTVCPKVRRGEPIDNFETEFVQESGKSVDVSISWTPLFDDQGKTAGCSVTVRDISVRKEAEKRVSEFYSMVSHELRTPLTSIRGVLGLLEGNVVEAGSSEAAELLGVARVSADRLIRLINDMLDLRKVESGKMELKRSKIAVSELVSESLCALTGMAEELGIKLVHNTESGGNVYADWDKATQIVTNLVSNALKFSPRGSEVSVVTEMRGEGRIRFLVIDNGSGIAAEDIGKLFQKFQQLDSTDSRQKGGTGLGLSIAKALVEQHEGSIGVESMPGQGSTFWFELPTFVESAIWQPVLSKENIATVDGSTRRHVLLVEDDDGLAAVLGTFLSSQNYQVRRATTLAEAKASATEMTPDVVVLDLTLPDGSGLDLVKDLRARAETLHTPVIVITGQQRQEQLLGNGTIVDWLSKPFDGEQLIRAIDRALGLSGVFKVLVVDDDNDIRMVVATQLNAMGLECIEAKDGSEAISFALSESPDLIVLDVLMPKVDGYGVVEALKEEARTTPLLIYTCSDLSAADRDLLTLGVTRHLTKGTASQLDLAMVVHELLGKVTKSHVGQTIDASYTVSGNSSQDRVASLNREPVGRKAI